MQRNMSASEYHLAREYCQRAWGYHLNRWYDLAIEDYTRAIELNPTFTTAYLQRGWAYGALGLYDRAIEDHTRFIELDPDEFAYRNRGETYQAKGQYDLAIKDLNHAIELDPTSVSAYNHRGVTYNKQERYGLAIKDFIHAIELVPMYAEAYKNLENLLSGIKHNDDLSGIEKPDLFKAIQKLPREKQIPLLNQCLDEKTPLGKQMWKPRYDFFLPFSSETTSCSLEKGILKEICAYLTKIDPSFVKPSRDSISTVTTVGLSQENDIKTHIKLGDAYFAQKNFEAAIQEYSNVIPPNVFMKPTSSTNCVPQLDPQHQLDFQDYAEVYAKRADAFWGMFKTRANYNNIYLKAAESDLTDAIKIDPQNERASNDGLIKIINQNSSTIIRTIHHLPDGEKIIILSQCLDPTTALGEKMIPKEIFLGIFKNDPLTEIKDYLKKLKSNSVIPVHAASITTNSMFEPKDKVKVDASFKFQFATDMHKFSL